MKTLESILKLSLTGPSLAGITLAVCVSVIAIPTGFAQKIPSEQEVLQAREQAQYQEKLQQVLSDKAGYAASIVARWQADAVALGRWDTNYASDLFLALMRLGPENLLAAGEATSYEGMMSVLATGQRVQSTATTVGDAAGDLGDFFRDLVYTPVQPCRIVDTRNIGSPIVANSTRSFDVDGSNFSGQGGNPGPCGIPFGVAAAVVMVLTATQPNTGGFFTAWAVGASRPLSSMLNFTPIQDIASTTIVPVLPGAGNDFNLFSGGATVHAVIDVLGYFAAPLATALDCNLQQSAGTAVAPGTLYSVSSPSCPTGFTVSGGGQRTSAFSPMVSDSGQAGNGWICQGSNFSNVLTPPGTSITVFCQARCCRVPGR